MAQYTSLALTRRNSNSIATPLSMMTLWTDRDNMSTPSASTPLVGQKDKASAVIDQWRERSPLSLESNDSSTSAKKHRVSYNCGRCGGPKKDHHCQLSMEQNSAGAQTNLNYTRKKKTSLPSSLKILSVSKPNDPLACSTTIRAIAHEKNTTTCTELNQVIISRPYTTCV